MIFSCGRLGGGVCPAFSRDFVEVDDIDEYIGRATKLGAAVIVPTSELPDGDALAVVLDPAGLSFGLYRPRRVT
jgi:predicted enzyme related to lactoylglutathione lyase